MDNKSIGLNFILEDDPRTFETSLNPYQLVKFPEKAGLDAKGFAEFYFRSQGMKKYSMKQRVDIATNDFVHYAFLEYLSEGTSARGRIIERSNAFKDLSIRRHLPMEMQQCL